MSDEPTPGRFATFRNLSGRQNGHGPAGVAAPAPPSTAYDATPGAPTAAAPTPFTPDELRAGGWLSAPADDALMEDAHASRGVHAITKKTDYWFEREVAVIERKAVEMASEWASTGLPRHDVPRTGPLEPEQFLAMRCAQTFREWQLRVRTKMQDAVERSSQQLGEHVGTVRDRLARLQTLEHELTEREGKIEKIRAEMDAAAAEPVRYAAFIPNWVFWVCAVLLAGVEFFANFPVFRLLLPLDAELEQAAASAAQNVDDRSWGAGVELFGRNLVWNVEAGLVALVAVIVLVVLGKQVGKSLRPVVALRAADHPLAARTVRAHQRQHLVSAGISLFGLVCVLGFLTASRGQIAQTAASRVVQDSLALVEAQGDFASAQANQNRNAMSEALTRVQLREEALQRHKDAAAYAATVQLNNWPILLLNLGLVATAAMLGFGNARADLGDRQGEHPDLVRLRDRCNELRRDLVSVEAETRAAVGQARASIGNVQHLLRAHPLRGWESKMKRLAGVLPLFRGENAQRRGLDPANIRAFDDPPVFDLPPVDESLPFAEPTEFARLTRELDALLQQLAHFATASTTARDRVPVA